MNLNTELLQSKDGPVKKFHILKEYGALLRQTKTNDELKRMSCAELTELVQSMSAA